MLSGEHGRRRYVCDLRLDLVLHAGDDVALALHHGSKAGLGDIGGSILLGAADAGFDHAARSKNRVSVAPGIRQVTVTPLSRSSSRRAKENELKALVPL